MSESEVANLITYINAIDPRVVIDDHKVIVWKRLLSPHIAFSIAQEMVDIHYRNTNETIMPSDINSLYQRGRSVPVFTAIEAPAVPVDHEWRKIVAADVKAKLQLDKSKEYETDGIKWDSAMGTGEYATAAGVDVFDEDLIWEANEIPE